MGESVCNTLLSGDRESLSDPWDGGEFITVRMPGDGEGGVNDEEMESDGARGKGVIVRQYQSEYSNFRATQALHIFLEKHGVIGICDIDTRYLTKMLRTQGAMMMIASTKISDKAQLKELLEATPRIEEVNYIQEVSTKSAYRHTSGVYNPVTFKYNEAPKTKAKIAAIDFGVKRNILNELTQVGLEVNVYPNDFSADDLIAQYDAHAIDGVFLSNGPGDPLVLKKEQDEIKKLIARKIPLFGICLGHQLLSIAHGHDTHKLKFGHHGGNHPVKKVKTGMVEITAQNHNYNVPELVREIAEVTHVNLFDNTIEGLSYKTGPVFSVQHHPEASPGPKESRYIFEEFLTRIQR